MQITILDTGYLSTERLGTQQVTADRANGGSAMTLKAIEVTSEGGANTDNSPNPASYAMSETNFASYENDTHRFSGILDKKTSSDYLLVRQIARLKETKGIKLLYPSATTDNKKNVVELLGAKNTGVSEFSGNEVGGSVPHLMGRVKSYRVRDGSDGDKFRIEFVFEETG